ncbi:hypothetical protein GCM10009847_04380 [Leucobacter tardus]|nr:hypothetical protein [Leucobacter tardus]
MFDKILTLAAWFYGVVFVGAAVATLGLVVATIALGESPIQFESH